MLELIFCLGIAAVYMGIGIIIAISVYTDVEDDIMAGACITLWPIFLFIELFRRKK